MLSPDWHEMFSPALPIAEVFLRGSLTYLGIFLLMRLVRRETGTISVADILVVVLIADAAQNGMSGEYTSLTEAAVLVATIVFWSVAVDWAGLHSSLIGRLLHPQPIELISNGRAMRQNMRRNMITLEELMTSVRQAGAEDIARVKHAWLEGNGEVSVILNDDSPSR